MPKFLAIVISFLLECAGEEDIAATIVLVTMVGRYTLSVAS